MVKAVYPDAEVEFENHDTVGARVAEIADAGLGDYAFLVIADMLPNDETLVRRLHKALPVGAVRIFDHHQNQEYLNELGGCTHDFERCSGLITAHEMKVDDNLLDFAELVDVWDRYQDGHEEFDWAFDLNLLHKFIGQKAFIERGARILFDEIDEAIISGMRRKIDSQSKTALESLRKFRDREGRVFAFAVGFESPAVSHEIYENHRDIDYVAVWEPHHGSMSMYSRKGTGTNVSEIARSLGGGGHENASGFSPKSDLVKLLASAVFGGR
jgi:oligoribonuclease NrnB/cAMP/cGMP phosphodiesterase (DHH superfamily)